MSIVQLKNDKHTFFTGGQRVAKLVILFYSEGTSSHKNISELFRSPRKGKIIIGSIFCNDNFQNAGGCVCK